MLESVEEGFNKKITTQLSAEEEIMSRYMSGFHRCHLDDPIHLDFASEGFLEMIGYTREEITVLFGDKCTGFIYPEDIPTFRKFIHQLASHESSATLKYRIVNKAGEVFYVQETVSSRRDAEGVMWGFSSVVKLPDDPRTSDTLKILDEMVPCGIMHLTHTHFPVATYISNQMMSILCVDESNSARLREIQSNVLFMVPFEGREAFLATLAEADKSRKPVHFAMRVQCCNGSLRDVMGWVNVQEGETGQSFYQLVIIDASIHVRGDKASSTEGFLRNMASVYDVVIEFDRDRHLARCIQDRCYNIDKHVSAMRYEMNDALDLFLISAVEPVYKEPLTSFFNTYVIQGASFPYDNPPTIEFVVVSPFNGERRKFFGTVARVDDAFTLFCALEVAVRHRAGVDADNGDELAAPLAADVRDPGGNVAAMPDIDYAALRERPQVQPTASSELIDEKGIFVRTFGYFDVFVDGRPVLFRHEKAKELLALLIDRRGGFVTPHEAIGCLWENEPVNNTSMARYRKVAMRLKDTLKEYGIESILVSAGGKRCVDPALLRCDLYDYLSDETKFAHLFRGSYLLNYSWGEVTLAELQSPELQNN